MNHDMHYSLRGRSTWKKRQQEEGLLGVVDKLKRVAGALLIVFSAVLVVVAIIIYTRIIY